MLRLAAWFDEADDDSAHALFTAAFATHPAKHLGGSTEDSGAAADSWWTSPAADTSAVRPGVRGAVVPVEDHGQQQARLRDEAEAAAHWRRSAAEEVSSLLAGFTPETGRITMTESALGVLVELLTKALGTGDATAGPVTAGDLELDIRLHVRYDSDAVLTIGTDGGDLTLKKLRLRATPYDQREADPEPSGRIRGAETADTGPEETTPPQ